MKNIALGNSLNCKFSEYCPVLWLVLNLGFRDDDSEDARDDFGELRTEESMNINYTSTLE